MAVLSFRMRAPQAGEGRIALLTSAPGNEVVSVPYKIAGEAEWQKITVELPVKEKTSILRLYLPSGSAAVEIDEIVLRPEAGPPRSWNF
jgi:hypothetical protein